MRARQGAKNQATLLEQAAGGSMLAGCFFWGLIFFVNLEPVHPIEYALVMFLAFAYGTMLPLLVNMLIPFSPASQLLQETRWKTVGFVFSAIIGIGMLAHAGSVVHAYLLTKPVVVANGLELGFSFGFVTVFVLFPALSLPQVSPERWAAEIKIAAEVKRYRLASKAHLAAQQVEHVLFVSRLRRLAANGVSNITRDEIPVIRDYLLRLHDQENRTIEQIIGCMNGILGQDSGIAIVSDRETADVLDQVAHQLYLLTDRATKREEISE